MPLQAAPRWHLPSVASTRLLAIALVVTTSAWSPGATAAPAKPATPASSQASKANLARMVSELESIGMSTASATELATRVLAGDPHAQATAKLIVESAARLQWVGASASDMQRVAAEIDRRKLTDGSEGGAADALVGLVEVENLVGPERAAQLPAHAANQAGRVSRALIKAQGRLQQAGEADSAIGEQLIDRIVREGVIGQQAERLIARTVDPIIEAHKAEQLGSGRSEASQAAGRAQTGPIGAGAQAPVNLGGSVASGSLRHGSDGIAPNGGHHGAGGATSGGPIGASTSSRAGAPVGNDAAGASDRGKGGGGSSQGGGQGSGSDGTQSASGGGGSGSGSGSGSDDNDDDGSDDSQGGDTAAADDQPIEHLGLDGEFTLNGEHHPTESSGTPRAPGMEKERGSGTELSNATGGRLGGSEASRAQRHVGLQAGGGGTVDPDPQSGQPSGVLLTPKEHNDARRGLGTAAGGGLINPNRDKINGTAVTDRDLKDLHLKGNGGAKGPTEGGRTPPTQAPNSPLAGAGPIVPPSGLRNAASVTAAPQVAAPQLKAEVKAGLGQ